MKIKLAFSHTTEDQFLVTADLRTDMWAALPSSFVVTQYDHEDTFLGLAIAADLREEELYDTVQAVLLNISKPVFPPRWVELDLSDRQIETLGLDVLASGVRKQPESIENLSALHDFFMRAPVPLVILMGPEHCFTFVNPPYVHLMRRESPDSILGKTVRAVLPELKGQPFFKLLDDVYRTGVPFIGRETPAKIRCEESGEMEDCLFDFIYEPIRSASGQVEGIMVQATDVTQAVLERQVSEDREKLLFRQWTELEAIYRTAPIGLSLMDVQDFRVLRFNQRSAEMVGCRVDEMIGRPVLEAVPGVPGLRALLERVAAGESVLNQEIEGELPSSPGVHRSWNLDATPIFDASGRVSAITTLATETTSMKLAEARFVESEKQATAGLLAESIAGQIADPLENLRVLMGLVGEEIRRTEAHAALDVAMEELRRISGVMSDIQRRYGLPVESKVLVGVGAP